MTAIASVGAIGRLASSSLTSAIGGGMGGNPVGGALGGAASFTAPVGGAAAQAAPAVTLGGASPAGAAPDAGSLGGSFMDSLGSALGSLNGQLTGADASMANFASGGSADIHSVMLEMQEASIGLQTGIAVRDKLLEAYQEIMRLSI
jgi:flagellar hook-basal body complex protein FliE